METKEIIENKKLIAKFMNYANGRPLTDDLLKTLYNDWNSLMPVVEKIESLGYEVLIGRISCQVNEMLQRENPICNFVCGDISKKIDILYTAIVEFIKWYNLKK